MQSGKDDDIDCRNGLRRKLVRSELSIVAHPGDQENQECEIVSLAHASVEVRTVMV